MSKDGTNPKRATALLAAGAIFCGLGVAFGALGAHALKKPVQDWYPAEKAEAKLDNWDTAVQYQIVHGLGLIAAGMCAGTVFPNSAMTKATGFLFATGIALFCGGLYVWVLTDWRPSVMIVPLGGVSFIVGWAVFAFQIVRSPAAGPSQ
jgi:uncharacterized membrane protein YgdD (TMEM256/DUF423 family)